MSGVVCVFVFVVVFVIVFVSVFVSSYDFWIAFNISFQNMCGYRGLWNLWAEIMIIFKVMTDIHTYTHAHTHSPIPLIDSAHPVGWAEWKDFVNRAHLNMHPSATGPTQLYPGLGQAITMLPWYLELILYHGLGQYGIYTFPWSWSGSSGLRARSTYRLRHML